MRRKKSYQFNAHTHERMGGEFLSFIRSGRPTTASTLSKQTKNQISPDDVACTIYDD